MLKRKFCLSHKKPTLTGEKSPEISQQTEYAGKSENNQGVQEPVPSRERLFAGQTPEGIIESVCPISHGVLFWAWVLTGFSGCGLASAQAPSS